MELRHLRTFLAVAEELHFGAAAERLYLSPPTVTEHIQSLERELGTPLLHRGRGVALTEAGAALVGHARQAVAHADAAVAAAREFADGTTGHLRIGILSNGAGALTPLIIRAYMTAHPRVRVSVTRLNFTDHLAALAEHRVHVAFVRPAPADDDRFDVLPLSSEDRVAVLPAAHPLAGAAEVPVAEVLDEPFTALPDGAPPGFAGYLHLRDHRGGLPPRTADVTCGDVIDVLAAVSAGRAVASAVESFRGYENWPGVAYGRLAGAAPAANALLTRHADPFPLVSAFIATADAMSARQRR